MGVVGKGGDLDYGDDGSWAGEDKDYDVMALKL